MSSSRSESIDKLALALSKAQAKIKPALKDSQNPFFKSHYADLESVWEACRDALTSEGLAVVQFPINEARAVGVETTLLHASGQFMSNRILIELSKIDAQSVGSLVTYLRRYSLAAVTGTVQTDDDANAAVDRGPSKIVVDAKAGAAAVAAHNQVSKRKDAVTSAPQSTTDGNGTNSPRSKSDYIISLGTRFVGKKVSELESEDLMKLGKALTKSIGENKFSPAEMPLYIEYLKELTKEAEYRKIPIHAGGVK